MKYNKLNLGTIEAIVNKLGGMEGVEAFLSGNVKITVVKHTIDLGKAPQLPFDNAEVVKHESEINGKKVVEIELRSDDQLYIDGRKWFSTYQNVRWVTSELLVTNSVRNSSLVSRCS